MNRTLLLFIIYIILIIKLIDCEEFNPTAEASADSQQPSVTSTSVLPLNNFDDRSLLDLFGEV